MTERAKDTGRRWEDLSTPEVVERLCSSAQTGRLQRARMALQELERRAELSSAKTMPIPQDLAAWARGDAQEITVPPRFLSKPRRG